MEHTCAYCKESKSAEKMAVRGGKVSRQCLECKQSRASLGAGAPKKKGKHARPEAHELRMMVPGGGHGFEAVVTDEDALQITQDNPGEDADNIVLTRHEGKQLVTMIGLWLARPAAES